jgi:xanthine dehydrogenase accessory factor
MKLDDLRRLNTARHQRQTVLRITDLHGGRDSIVVEGEACDPLLAETVMAAFRSGKSGSSEIAGRTYFIDVQVPPPQIVVIGAAHLGQVLAQMAQLAGFAICVIDPRAAFATPQRFPNIELYSDWPDEVFSTRPLDACTALVALSHDPKIDDFPVAEALRAGCFYVGALGGRKSHSLRLQRLAANGFSAADLGRIRGPIGLDIGAIGPAEIAIAILAEIVQSLRRRSTASKQ